MTMFVAFTLEAIAILILFAFIDQPALFVVLTGLVFFGWGEIFSLFPSTLTDTFGPKYAAKRTMASSISRKAWGRSSADRPQPISSR